MKTLAALGAVLAAATSCGDVVRNGRAPVQLVINSIQAAPGGGHGANQFVGFLLSDVLVLLTSPAPCTADNPCPTIYDDSGQAQLTIVPKDLGSGSTPIAPSQSNAVTITRVHIKYTRADGRNVQGVDVPYEFDAAATATVNSATTAVPIVFELVRHAAKEEPPLMQLETSPSIINTIAEITFYGTDLVGNAVQATGTIQVNFGNFGDS
ncbi:MAG TPA: hypothetical protein VFA27_15490 [Vicinamibacterales bacterium]|nr:hypothetical protein [Vicinamibacterales bacterium]